MSVRQAEMCWKISAKKIQLFPKMRVGEKHSVSLMGKEKKKKGGKEEEIGDIFTAKLTCSHVLPWNWQEGVILLGIMPFFYFPTFHKKIDPVWATYKPLKSCSPCEFTTTWDWKELLMDWIQSHAIMTNVQWMSRCFTIWMYAPASPWPPNILLQCSITKHWKHEVWY